MFAASKSGKAAAAAAATDPYFPYVPLLLNTTSTNGQQNNTFLDSSTNNFTITRNGTPTQGAFTPYQPSGYWSGLFNGSTTSLIVAYNSTFLLNSDFTIESWIFPTASAQQCIISMTDSGGNTNWDFYVLSGNTVRFRWINTGTTVYSITSSAISLNQWIHVAATLSGTTLTLYVNGVSAGTTTISGSARAISSPVGIGKVGDYPADYFNGYISNLRFVKGTAVYTSNFTPPTTPLTAITNTSLLTLQSNRFIDNSSNAFAITVNGTPKVQAFQPFAPAASYSAATYGGSGYFNGSTDYLSAASNAAFGYGTGDFTIEFWIYPTSISASTPNIFDQRNGSPTSVAPTLYLNNGVLSYYINGLTVITGSTLIANAWYHVALCRSSSSTKMFLNGVQVGSTYADSNNYVSSPVRIFSSNDGTAIQAQAGYCSNLRIVKGTAVYTANFTPPSAPVTAITNTSLLTNFTNAGIYDAAWQNDVTTVGDAQASTTQYKWSPTSMKFDGTGDWLTAIDNPGLQLGSGDFTIEGWVYLSANGVIYGILSKGTATTGWSVNVTVLNKLQFSYTASNLTGATSLSASTWYYFAVVRSGTATGNLKVYLNGTVDATSGGAVTDNFNQTNTLYVGADRIGTSPLNGYLQDVRITKYARTITTPTAAFPTR